MKLFCRRCAAELAPDRAGLSSPRRSCAACREGQPSGLTPPAGITLGVAPGPALPSEPEGAAPPLGWGLVIERRWPPGRFMLQSWLTLFAGIQLALGPAYASFVLTQDPAWRSGLRLLSCGLIVLVFLAFLRLRRMFHRARSALCVREGWVLIEHSSPGSNARQRIAVESIETLSCPELEGPPSASEHPAPLGYSIVAKGAGASHSLLSQIPTSSHARYVLAWLGAQLPMGAEHAGSKEGREGTGTVLAK
jgi:hypothetical protein